MVRSISEIRRDEITDAVLQLLAVSGLAAISIQAIADSVGMGKSSLYNYYTSVDELIEAAISKGEKVMLEYLHSAVKRASGPYQALIGFVSDIGANSAAVALERIVSDSSQAANPWRARLVKIRDKINDKLAGLVKAAQIDREIRNDVDPGDVVTMLLSLLVYQYIAHRVIGDRQGLEAGVSSAIAIFRRLVAPPA